VSDTDRTAVSPTTAETPPETTATPPETHWAAPSEKDAVRRPDRPAPIVVLVGLWAIAIVAAGLSALLASRRSGATSGSPEAAGYVIGALLAPFVVALIVRAAIVLIRRRRGAVGGSVVRSEWVPLGALILTGVALVGNIAALGPLRPVAPADAIRISGPFTLRAASADTQRIAEAGFKNDKTIRAYEVREVVGQDGSLSLLVVTDAGLRDQAGAIEQLGRGIESASGLTATYETIRDRRVAIAVGETLSIGSWIEEPLALSVYAVTPTRLHQIIEAILDAKRPSS